MFELDEKKLAETIKKFETICFSGFDYKIHDSLVNQIASLWDSYEDFVHSSFYDPSHTFFKNKVSRLMVMDGAILYHYKYNLIQNSDGFSITLDDTDTKAPIFKPTDSLKIAQLVNKRSGSITPELEDITSINHSEQWYYASMIHVIALIYLMDELGPNQLRDIEVQCRICKVLTNTFFPYSKYDISTNKEKDVVSVFIGDESPHSFIGQLYGKESSIEFGKLIVFKEYGIAELNNYNIMLAAMALTLNMLSANL